MERAPEEAARLDKSSIEPEHIFLAVLSVDGGVAGIVLGRLGVTLADARQVVESTLGRGGAPARRRHPRFSPDAKRLLERAVEEAHSFKHTYIGTEHLLLGMFHLEAGSGQGSILDVLRHFRLDEAQVRGAIVRELASRSLPETGTRNNVLMCRVTAQDLEAIDTLVEAGVRATRSDAAAWLIRAGIDGNTALFGRLQATVGEIRRLREQAQAISRQVASDDASSSPAGSDA